MALRLALAVFLVAGCAALGRRISRSSLTGLSHLAWDAPTGLAALTALILAVGLLPGMFARGPLLGFVATVLAVAIVWDRIAVRGVEPTRLPENDRVAVWVATGLIGLVAVVGFVWDRVPAVFYDTLSYHFAQPELWLLQGRIQPASWSLHSWFPAGMSALFGTAMAAGGEAAANDVNLVAGLMLLAMAADLSRRLFGARAAPFAVALLATLPITIFALGIPAADLGHGAFCFGSLGALVMERREPGGVWLRRAGILAAGAVLTKYLGWLAPVGVGTVWLLIADRSRPFRAAWVVVPALIAALPWLVADARATGNPIAPVLAGTIRTAGLAQGGVEAFTFDARGRLPRWEELKSVGRRLVTGDEQASRIYPTPAWGFALVLAAAVGLWLRRDDPALSSVGALAVVLFAIWLLTYRWERFLIPCSGFLAVTAAGALAPLTRGRDATLALPAIVALLAALGAWRATLDLGAFTGGAQVAFGSLSPEVFVSRALPFTDVYAAAARILDPAHDQVLLLGDNRHFRLRVPHAAPTVFNAHPLAGRLAAGDAPQDALVAMRRLGFTHLIVDPSRVRSGAIRYPSLAVFRGREDLLTGLLDALPAPLAEAGGAALFALPEAR